MDPLTGDDVTDPRSRHNRHVTDPSDLRGVGPWTRETLYTAVKTADDGDDRTVVLDYGRRRLYFAAAEDLSYDPPGALGLGSSPALHVAVPLLYDPDAGETEQLEADRVTVSPEFDVLVPAFDWTEVDDDPLPPVDRRDSPARTGAGAGTPG